MLWEVYEVLSFINKNIYITPMNLSTDSGFVRKNKASSNYLQRKGKKGNRSTTYQGLEDRLYSLIDRRL